MTTQYPFKLPFTHKHLPRPGRDGLTLLDVRVKGKWEGVLVVNANFECVGIRSNRETIEWDLPFVLRKLRTSDQFQFGTASSLPIQIGSYSIHTLVPCCSRF